MKLQRRHLISLAVGLGLSEHLLPTLAASAQDGTSRTRQDIVTFAADPAKLAALRSAVKRMKERSAADTNDPFGWDYWAAVHRTTIAPPANLKKIYNQCDHSNNNTGYVALHFLSWHRAFLMFFETVLKQAASEVPGTVAIDLPYWDWYATGKMPDAFTTGDATTNPLWHRRVRTDLTGAGLDRGFYSLAPMLPGDATANEDSFTWRIEDDPHSAVHGLIGGDMGSIPTSARDPIFWIHHANIDRLWTAWLKNGQRQLPAAGSDWAGKTWSFDLAGKWTQVAGAMFDEGALGYGYDNEKIPGPSGLLVAAVATTIVANEASVMMAQATSPTVTPATKATSFPLSSTPGAVSLSNSAVAVQLNLAPEHKNQLLGLQQVQPSSTIKSASLVLDAIKVTGEGGFSFSVVVSTASGAKTSLGTLNTFTLGGHSHEEGGQQQGVVDTTTLRYPLAPILAKLHATSLAGLGPGLTVTFVPQHPSSGQDAAPYLTIGSVRIEGSTLPVQ